MILIARPRQPIARSDKVRHDSMMRNATRDSSPYCCRTSTMRTEARSGNDRLECGRRHRPRITMHAQRATIRFRTEARRRAQESNVAASPARVGEPTR
jgi:hypothetical protein